MILAKVDCYLSEIHRWPLFERQTANMSNPSTLRDGIQVRELILTRLDHGSGQNQKRHSLEKSVKSLDEMKY